MVVELGPKPDAELDIRVYLSMRAELVAAAIPCPQQIMLC